MLNSKVKLTSIKVKFVIISLKYMTFNIRTHGRAPHNSLTESVWQTEG